MAAKSLLSSGTVSLTNGHRVITFPAWNAKENHITVVVKAGNRFDAFARPGTAAFFERNYLLSTLHSSAEIMKKRMKELFPEQGKFTMSVQREFISYQASFPPEKTKEVVELLKEMLFEPKFDPVEVEKEKEPWQKELASRLKIMPLFLYDFNHMAAFGKSPLGKPLFPSPDSVQKLSTTFLKDFHRDYFISENMVFLTSGVDPASFSTLKLKEAYEKHAVKKTEYKNRECKFQMDTETLVQWLFPVPSWFDTVNTAALLVHYFFNMSDKYLSPEMAQYSDSGLIGWHNVGCDSQSVKNVYLNMQKKMQMSEAEVLRGKAALLMYQNSPLDHVNLMNEIGYKFLYHGCTKTEDLNAINLISTVSVKDVSSHSVNKTLKEVYSAPPTYIVLGKNIDSMPKLGDF